MRLLVVDDDTAVRMVLAMTLDGVEVVEGWRIGGAVAAASVARVDAALVDRRLPDGDGLDLVRQLRADPATADLPVVVVTASDDPAERAAAFAAGADEHAVKPLDPERVLALVEGIVAVAVDQRRLRRVLRRARMHVGRPDGGWSDLLPDAPAPVEARRRRWLARS